MNKNILFVSHDAAIMGAPMVLLHLLKWIKTNTATNITIILKESGPLQSEFEQMGSVFIWRPKQLPSSLGRRIISRIHKYRGKGGLFVPFPKKLIKKHFDLVYLNTADTADFAPITKTMFGCPVITHIHELSYSIKAYFPNAFNHENVSATNHYLAVCESIRENLIINHHIPSQKITVFNEFIPIAAITKPTADSILIREELNLTGKFIVGASGSAGWRKGTDLFIQLAYKVNKKLPESNIVFIWIGNQSNEAKAQADYEIEKYNLKNKLFFTGIKTDPQNYYQAFDVFTLTSREDPFPLVCLEAAALEKPVFCFKDTGGIAEITPLGFGLTFDYGDIESMANGIIDAYRNRDKIIEMGKKAALNVKQYDVNIIAPQIYNTISTFING